MEIEKVVDALNTIKQCCVESESCMECPIRDPRSTWSCCVVNNTIKPENWKINARTWPQTAFGE